MINAKVRLTGWLLDDPQRLARVLTNWLNEQALSIKADFGVTVQTWQHKPEFTITAEGNTRTIGTDATQGAGRIYKFVALGTRVRYALMSTPFQAKTTPGFIGSTAGLGRVVVISKKHPRPGIVARRFPQIIAAKWQKEAPEQLQRAIDAEASKQA